MSDWKMNFCTNFELKLLRVTIENANIGSLKSLPTLFDMCLDHIMVKMQNRMVINLQNFELFN